MIFARAYMYVCMYVRHQLIDSYVFILHSHKCITCARAYIYIAVFVLEGRVWYCSNERGFSVELIVKSLSSNSLLWKRTNSSVVLNE